MAHYECPVKVKRIDENCQIVYKEVMSGELVPGEVFVVPEKYALPCDAILISGEAIVNEAMLTGESTASNKIEIPNEEILLSDFNVLNTKQIKHFLFSGTTVIKSLPTHNNESLAIVVHTGFSSIKGSLIKSLLYPAPERFNFHNEIKIYILVLILFSTICIGITLPTLIKYFGVNDIIVATLDAFTFCVPPELPIAMSVGVIFALRKLKENHISCINVSRINVSGRVSIMVFDKTGTLTESGISLSKLKILDYNSSIPKFLSHSKHGLSNSMLSPETWNDKTVYFKNRENPLLKYIECLASCHSLVSLDDKILGDPLEIEMFKVTEWVLNDERASNSDSKMSTFGPKNSDYKLYCVHQFNFLSELQLMSVIVKNNYENCHYLFTKGSPERIYEICKKDKIPKDFFAVLQKYTSAGKRVIAFAYKELSNFEPKSLVMPKREDFECNLSFLGFLIFTNKLMPETIPSIEKLKKGNVASIMATGDNLLTGVSVAHKCGILSSNTIVTIDMDSESHECFCMINHVNKEIINDELIFSKTSSYIEEDLVEESEFLLRK